MLWSYRVFTRMIRAEPSITAGDDLTDCAFEDEDFYRWEWRTRSLEMVSVEQREAVSTPSKEQVELTLVDTKEAVESVQHPSRWITKR